MNLMTRALALVCIAMCAATASAQTATGTSGTQCTQAGSLLTCTTSTTMTLPSGVNLTPGAVGNQFGLTGSATGPNCSNPTALPPTVPAGGTTPVQLSITCPTSSNYSYAWNPAVTGTGATVFDTPNLSSTVTFKTYTVQVCFQANPQACNTYPITVNLTAATQPLSGCAISPQSVTVNQGASGQQLNATCTQGTETGTGATYQWTRNNVAIANATGPSYTLTASDTATAGQYQFGVTINNNASVQAVPPPATVTVSAVVVGDPGACPNSPIRTVWNASSPYLHLYTSDFTGSFTAGDNFVIQLNVTAGDSTAGRYIAAIDHAGTGSSPHPRIVTVSKTKCDYTASAYWLTPYRNGVPTASTSDSATISLNEPSAAADMKLTTGTWYINVKNPIGSCPSNQSCHALLDWYN